MFKRVELTVKGQVQGVGFRYSAMREAKKLGLTGWVMNAPEGTVVITAEGAQGDLKDFIEWCYNDIGSARVQKIAESWSEPTNEFSDFIIKYTL